MGRWRNHSNKKAKKARMERENGGGNAGGGGANNPNGFGYQGKNVDERGWIVTPAQHPNHREPQNPVFEAFYRAQGIVPAAEWKVFMKTLLEPLPASFRINLDCDFAELLLSEVEGHMAKRVKVDDVEVEPIKKLTWFTGGHAYQLALDRRTLRRDDTLKDFHELMKQHTDAGSITRQETVSMIPPVVLDVEPHHRVLDMCAAPGSKTSQMLEVVSHGCSRTGVEPEGYVLANDAETSRAYMLVHQCKRINTAALCVTTHRAQAFPGRGFQGGQGGAEVFDRVLCDVPCTGDGTVRKTFNIWRSWYPGNAMGLHPLQLQIARRGAELTKVGGLMVYSTCSLNPIEDEAVVLALLQEANGALELVDPRPRLPGLKVRDGLHSWRVIDSENRLGGKVPPPQPYQRQQQAQGEQGEKEGAKEVEAGAEAEAEAEAEVEWNEENAAERLKALGLREIASYADVPEGYQRLFRPTHFPPQDPDAAKQLNLHYCMRCLPHDQDTGGFFVALLRKVAPFGGPRSGQQQAQQQARQQAQQPEGGDKGAAATPAAPARAEAEAAAAAAAVPEPAAAEDKEGGKGKDKGAKGGGGKKAGGGSQGQERFSAFAPKEFFTPLAEDAWAEIRAFYGVADTFPRERLFCRRETAKVVSYMSKALVTDVQLSQDSHLQLVNVGTKIFDRVSGDRSACSYRLAQDGLAFLLPFMTRRVVLVPLASFVQAVTAGQLDVEAVTDPAAKAALEALELGAFVVRLDPAALGGEDKAKEGGLASFAVMAWKGFGSKLRVMCQSSDLFLYRCRLRACGLATPEELTPPPPPAPKQQQQQQQQQPKQQQQEGAPAEAAEAAEAPMPMETAA